MNLQNEKKFKELDEKLLRVIVSCKTLPQYLVAMQYIRLVDRELRPLTRLSPVDMEFLTDYISRRKGFLMGIIWATQGRK